MNSKGKWAVHVPERVRKQVTRFPRNDGDRILNLLREIESNPWGGDIRKVKGEENKWARRTGNYRVFFSIHQDVHLVKVLETERRGDHTY